MKVDNYRMESQAPNYALPFWGMVVAIVLVFPSVLLLGFGVVDNDSALGVALTALIFAGCIIQVLSMARFVYLYTR